MAFNISIVAHIIFDGHEREVSADFIFEEEQAPTRGQLQSQVAGIVDDIIGRPAFGEYPAPGQPYTFVWEIQSVFEI